MLELRPGERLDDLHCNGYQLIQDPNAFCFGMDAVLLSDYANIKTGERAIDLGTGTGVIPILLKAKTKGSDFSGLELQEAMADMARRSVARNGLTDQIKIYQGDIKRACELFGPSSFHVVTVNPPYMKKGHGLANDADSITIARHEIHCTLEDVVKESARLLMPGGRFYMVHRPFRLAEILVVMNTYGLEPKTMRLVHPYADKEPNLVLIEGLKGGNSRMRIQAPLIVYKEAGVYTEEIIRIYGH
jgi:tRNA1Val (adenine37-N6)-methyltransferase